MAADRIGSFSTFDMHNASGNWYQNSVNDIKYKTVDKELQRIRGLGVVSVRKRYGDVSSISSASSVSNRTSDSSNEFKYIKNKLSKDSQLSLYEAAAQHSSKAFASKASGQTNKLSVQTKQLRSNSDSQLYSVHSDTAITMSALSFASASSAMTIKENKVETTDLQDEEQNFPESHNLEQMQLNIDVKADTLNHIEKVKCPAADSMQSITQQALPNAINEDEEIARHVGEASAKVEEQVDRNMSTLKEIPVEHTSNNEASDLRNTDNDMDKDVQQGDKPSEENVIESDSVQCEPHLVGKDDSIANIVSEMNILAEKAKEICKEQDEELAEKIRIRDELLKLVESLNVPGDALNDCNDEAALHSSEIAELRRQVRALNLKCELQQVDLQERAAYHSKLKTEKKALHRKLSVMTQNSHDNDILPKNLNRMSTGSNFSTASQIANYVTASRAGSRRLNARPESPLPPQLPPPRDPLPPIPLDQQPPAIASKDTAKRYSGVQIHTEHYDRIVQELLGKLREAKEEQSKSRTLIESLEIKLRKSQVKNLELEKSVRVLESERHELLRKQRASAPPLASPPQPPSSPTKEKKKRSRRSLANLLSIFSKK